MLTQTGFAEAAICGVFDTSETQTNFGYPPNNFRCSAPGSLDTSLSYAAGLIEIAACHA